MKENGTQEGCIEQIYRMFSDRVCRGDKFVTDDTGRIRMDDREMRAEVQAVVDEVWPTINTENLNDLTDFWGYQRDFLRLFGFGIDSVDYDADVDPVVEFEE